MAKSVPGVTSALAERLTGGRYIDVDIDRAAAGALRPEHRRRAGGRRRRRSAARTSARRSKACARFPINVRYPREMRDSLEKLRAAAVPDADAAQQITLGTVADDRASADGPPMLRSENARLSGWVYVDVRGRDLRFGGARPAAGGRDAR